jgi:hypothetical protein
LRKLSASHPAGFIGTVGLNSATLPIYQALGYRTGKLARHYLLNPHAAYRLAQVPAGFPRSTALGGDASLTPIGSSHFLRATERLGLDEGDQIPRKTRVFLYNRYATHPFYRYDAFIVSAGGEKGVVILRTCAHDGARALRVVDYVGAPGPLAGAGPAFAALLDEAGAEYLDFYCSGLADELSAAGFRVVGNDEGLVLPGYFEPYVARNVDLLFAIHGPDGRLVICKGDGDQDRPSEIAR